MNDDKTSLGFRSGFVALVGRPNAGKSTFLNHAIGEIISIVTPRPQTTRFCIRGIVNRPNSQIIFLDTPGIHLIDKKRGSSRRHAINRVMVSEAKNALTQVDLAVALVEAHCNRKPADFDAEDRLVIDAIRESGRPSLLAINKIDLLKQKEAILPLMAAYQKLNLFDELIPISAKTGDGMDLMLTAIESRLPQGARYFPEDMITDQPERIIVAEFIRQQVILQSGKEVPYSAAVEVESFEEVRENALVRIQAIIYVERDSQKGILIGKRGQKLKSIGSAARKSIERLLGCHVFLGLRIKVKANWSRSESGLQSVGLKT